MPTQLSPGVNVTEYDLTTIVPATKPLHPPAKEKHGNKTTKAH